MKLLLLRHGETDWNKSHRFQGQIDIPLNSFGRELAEITRASVPHIDYDRVYSSPLSRAYETAQIFVPGADIITDKRIIEISFGEYEGTDIELASKDPDHGLYQCLWNPELYVADKGAESFEHLVARAADFLNNEILPLGPLCHNVLVVSHGALIRAIVVAAGFKEIKDFWGTQYLNCSITTLDVSDGKISLIREAEVFYDPSTLKHHGWKK